MDPRENQQDLTTRVEATEENPFILHPGEFALGASIEVVSLDATVIARVEGKSSFGRLGLMIYFIAGFVDPGFSGTITLELSNIATLPIMLYPGMKIGQQCFMDLKSKCLKPYGTKSLGSKYQGQKEPEPSRYFLNHKTQIN